MPDCCVDSGARARRAAWKSAPRPSWPAISRPRVTFRSPSIPCVERLKSPLRPQNWPVAAAYSETLVFVWFNGFSCMAHAAKSLRTWSRTWQAAHRRARELRMIYKGLVSTDHPILAHIIPVRRCNLSCAYCNEYDDHSKPVPLETMYQRIDRLAELGTTIITISGGEPLLHPDLDLIVARIRGHRMIAGMITNGYLFTAERIHRLNRAGLEHLQISIDNVMPDEVSKKILKVLDKKLQLLAEHADFHVNINSVVGGGIRNPQDALVVGRRAVELGFDTSVGIIHDHDGQLDPLQEKERAVYDQILKERKPALFAFAYDNLFHKNLALGQPND